MPSCSITGGMKGLVLACRPVSSWWEAALCSCSRDHSVSAELLERGLRGVQECAAALNMDFEPACAGGQAEPSGTEDAEPAARSVLQSAAVDVKEGEAVGQRQIQLCRLGTGRRRQESAAASADSSEGQGQFKPCLKSSPAAAT